MSDDCKINTNTELFREIKDDYYSPSIHVTKNGKIGMDVGGYVYEKTIKEWHSLIKQNEKNNNLLGYFKELIIEYRKDKKSIYELIEIIDNKISIDLIKKGDSNDKKD